MSELLLSFYGDDNTGSTDALEALTLAGVRTVLFMSPPAPDDLARFPDVQAVGVAGMTRTMAPDALQATLEPALVRLAALGARVCHYKVCSTFDSSPEVGSIGRGLDVGARVFGTPVVPLVVGVPALGRYTLFGNLFAAAAGTIYRIDRHPTMSRHTVTPMDEGDLRVHLSKQTIKRIGLLDILELTSPPAELDARLDEILAGDPELRPEVLLFDVLDDARLTEVGRLIWRMASSQPLFAVGSSGLEYALVPVWRAQGHIPAQPPPFDPISPVRQLLVVSGSCSLVTQAQLDYVLDGRHGTDGDDFAGVAVDVAGLLDPATTVQARRAAIQQALELLGRGHSVVVHSARGPDDVRVRNTVDTPGSAKASAPGTLIGEQLGLIARHVLESCNASTKTVTRVAIVGGDTSGHCARSLGVQALQMIAPTTTGAPLCRAHARDGSIDGLDIVLRGGQMGRPDYFVRLRAGRFS